MRMMSDELVSHFVPLSHDLSFISSVLMLIK
jgi:hypothetical protein